MFAKLVGVGWSAVAVFAVFVVGVGLAVADTIPLTLSATVDATGTTTIDVLAPGCEPTPPGASDIVLQGRSATGEVGEGAVAVGGFSAPGQGSVVVPPGTPISSFLVSVSCNGGALTGSQAFVLAPAAAPVTTSPRFTG